MNKNGISLVILIITVIVLLIVASITIMQFSDLSQDAKAMKAINDMLIIQSKVQIEMENAKDVENYEYPGEENRLDEGEIEYYQIDENDVNDKWYYLGGKDLKEIGIYGIQGTYLVDYTTGEVVLYKGIIIDGREYNKLSDLLEVYKYIEL